MMTEVPSNPSHCIFLWFHGRMASGGMPQMLLLESCFEHMLQALSNRSDTREQCGVGAMFIFLLTM